MTNQTAATQPDFQIQRVFIKDLSFESPLSPAVFQQEWKPEINLQIQTDTQALEADLHEVVLKLTITAVTEEKKTAFLLEVKQAGIFLVKGFPAEQVGGMLGSVCPSILFPYARELVTDLVTRGTFPQLYLAPINFEALYMQHLSQQTAMPRQEEEVKH